MALDAQKIAAIGRDAGLCAVGVCRADPFSDTARVLRERKQAGLHAGMQFTYRNPQRSTNPSRLVPESAALIVGALEFDAGCEDPRRDDLPLGRVAAYARADHYAKLRVALEAMAAPLRGAGHRAVVTADENSLVDRAAAHRGAIGWWGKSANILVPGSGSMVVLGAVVTDAELVLSDPQPRSDGCGSCRECMDGCPTGAIVAPGKVDARRCLAWLLQDTGVFPPEFRVALGDRIYGCDDCAEACPPNQTRVRLGPRRPPAEAPCDVTPADAGPHTGAWVSLLEILDASDQALMSVYGRWYIPKREPRYLRRNALVVLANVADGNDERVRTAVERALADSDCVVRAHAVWCARRLGIGLEALADPDDPIVRSELAREVPLRGGS